MTAREMAARVDHDHQSRANRQRRQGGRVGALHGHSHREDEKKRSDKLNNGLRNRHGVLLVDGIRMTLAQLSHYFNSQQTFRKAPPKPRRSGQAWKFR